MRQGSRHFLVAKLLRKTGTRTPKSEQTRHPKADAKTATANQERPHKSDSRNSPSVVCVGYRWRDVLANSLLMYSGCARRHETHAPIREDVHPRSAPRVRVHVHMSIREYTNAAHEAVWFICARIVTRGASTAGASQR